MKAMPMIQKVMTAMPHTIGDDIPLKKAQEMMREFGFRHLPVQKGGKLVGILSDRDISVALAIDNADRFKVGDVMMPDPYTVAPEASLNQVTIEMCEHKYGCAVVQQPNGKVVGIFTVTDALRILSENLQQFYSPRN